MNFVVKSLFIGIAVILGLAGGFVFIGYLMMDAAAQGAGAFQWVIP
jgi:hypothetical protein